MLFSERLDVIGREQSHVAVDLPLPPFPVLLAQDTDDAAFVEAELIRRLSRVGVKSEDKVLRAGLGLGGVQDIQERLKQMTEREREKEKERERREREKVD